MFRRILVPLDGSAQAERAVVIAVRLAQACDGTVVLVQVIRPLVEYETMRPPHGTWLPAADNAARDAASSYLATLRQRASMRDVATESQVLVGPIAPLVVQAAEEQRADLVVMVTHARRGLSRWVLGSVADAVVHNAHVPVLVLRDSADASAASLSSRLGADHHPISALVALDGSPLAEAALAPAVHLVAAMSQERSQPLGGSVHLLRVVEPPPNRAAAAVLMSPFERADRRRAIAGKLREAREYLDATATRLRERSADALGISVTWSIGRGHDVAAIIQRVAQPERRNANANATQGADVIVMGTHGRGGVKRLLMGSVAERVLREATVPVLIVRPGSRAVATAPAADELSRASRNGSLILPRRSGG